MAVVKVGRAGRITLPAEVRRRLNVAEGDDLAAEVVDDGVLLRPMPAAGGGRAWARLFDSAAGVRDLAPKPGQSPREEEEEIAEAVKAFRRGHA